MNRSNRPNSPFEDANGMYYAYQSQLFPMYKLPEKGILPVHDYRNLPTYDFSSDLLVKRKYPKPQTVEDVIRNGYLSVPKGEPETAIITDKKNTSWLGLDDVIGQLQGRYEIYHRNIHDLELAKCAAISSLYEHEAHHGPADSRIEYSLNKRLDALYSDQREERVNLWRDVSKLKLLLPENAQQYLTAYRKVAILSDYKGDGL